VQTTYRLFNPGNSGANWFGVQRVFDFSATVFSHDFRPYIARLSLSAGYTEVLYPTPTGKLATMDVSACPGGCTGPEPAPGAAPLNPPWDSNQGWFAVHNPGTLQGVVVSRVPSTDRQGDAIAAQLWIDNDAGSDTNASSFLLVNPAAGFNGGLVTEAELLCFYDSTIWTPSVIPPPACRNIPMTLSPWNLTFVGQSIGSTSAPQTATLKNIGAKSVSIIDIVSSGDFAQTNNCPASLAVGATCNLTVTFNPSAAGIRSGSVSIVDLLRSSPQTLTLAGLGLSAQ
jgi:hypothetical protein